MSKIKVAVLYGGKSPEHEVSLQSGGNVIDAIDANKYEVISVKIEKDGSWDQDILQKIDVVFPVLHGPFGEDGTIQGLLALADVPFVGCNAASSAVCMDKDFTKRLLQQAAIAVAPYKVFEDHEKENINYEHITKELGTTLFIKPANMGSSVGVSKVTDKETFEKAIDLAFEYDTKLLIESAIEGREIECAILGNEDPRASLPGEVIPQKDFYSYEAKYIDAPEDGAILKVPAELTGDEKQIIQDISIKTFKALGCAGMARVDSFLTTDGKACINEVNTIPGFTNISQYPKLWHVSGIEYAELIDQLIQLALDRHQKESALKRTRV